MFERFTDRARRVIVLAQHDARDFGHAAIMPAHLFLALSEEGDGVAARAMAQVGADPAMLRERVEAAFDAAPARKAVDQVPFSPAAKKVMELSLREALQLGHDYIGTEHILLGLLRLARDDTAETVDLFGLSGDQLRQAVIALMSGAGRGDRLSPALTQAMDRARSLASRDRTTTGHLLVAMVDDPASQAAKTLASLGVTRDALVRALAQVAPEETSDAAPGLQRINVKRGALSVRVADPELVAKLRLTTPEQLLAALRRLVEEHPTGDVGDSEADRTDS